MAKYTVEEVREKYEKMAPRYDWVEGVPEVLGLWKLRRDLIRRAKGSILEVAAGTGRNFRYYPKGRHITAVDATPAMLKIAGPKAKKLGLDVQFQIMAGEALAFPDHSFDTVVSTLTLCTFSDPVKALQEMKRVCRPDGRILLLEHGRSSVPWLARWQDRHEAGHAEIVGCHWNREPLDLVRKAGFNPVEVRRLFFDMFYLIETPP
ncbi:MAG TPA: class I SAM-dependent methyltransferase [Nitrospiria bacterium]|nr:class I SAM-dependent methyltransferase [Nitrospiria bacterium]